jgi:hypothetical protein
MSRTTQGGYEFTPEQNTLIGGMATKMRGVGLFLAVVGILNLIAAIIVVLAIYRAKLPQNYVDTVVEKVAEATKADVKAQLANLPPDNHLWAIAIGSAVNGLIYLMIGAWTRSAAGSFRLIVDTRGSDISHLMDALSSLNKMYTLVYTLILVGLLFLIVTVGLFVYAQLTR